MEVIKIHHSWLASFWILIYLVSDKWFLRSQFTIQLQVQILKLLPCSYPGESGLIPLKGNQFQKKKKKNIICHLWANFLMEFYI